MRPVPGDEVDGEKGLSEWDMGEDVRLQWCSTAGQDHELGFLIPALARPGDKAMHVIRGTASTGSMSFGLSFLPK